MCHKYLKESEFLLLRRCVEKRKSRPFQVCFYIMAFLGLRVSDATALREENWSRDYCELNYTDKKTKVLQHKEVPPFLVNIISQYVEQYRHEFVDGFMFPPLHNRISKNKHLQTSTYRNFFVRFRRSYGFDKPYYTCKNGKKLYRISPHTLKHYCLYKVYKASGNDLNFTKTFSGHLEMKHTIRYIEHEDNRLKQAEVLEKAFNDSA